MFRKTLRILRIQNGLRQDDVAKFLGISRSAYSYYESGKSEPGIEAIKKITRLFNCSTDRLFFGDEEDDRLVLSSTNSELLYSEQLPPAAITHDESLLISYMRMLDRPELLLDAAKELFGKQEE